MSLDSEPEPPVDGVDSGVITQFHPRACLSMKLRKPEEGLSGSEQGNFMRRRSSIRRVGWEGRSGVEVPW